MEADQASNQAWEKHLIATVQSEPELQTWANHLEIRLPELRELAEALPEVLGDVLEIGCGNGIGSAYFSPRARSIVASDLPNVDHAAHAIGLEKARELFRALHLKNAKVVGCSAESIPFPDASFDTVLAVYSLEHLPDRAKALRECLRVLRPEGKLLASVPATCWSLTYPLAFYSEFGGRVLRRLTDRFLSPKSAEKNGVHADALGSSTVVVKDWRSFRKAYPQFPLPKPHGEYASYFDEVRSQWPERWIRQCVNAGFTNVKALPLQVVPRALLSLLFGNAGLRFFNRLQPWDRQLRQQPASLALAQFICLVAEKPAES